MAGGKRPGAGAPKGNTNAASRRHQNFRSAVNAMLSTMDDEAGVPDGTTHREILRGYIIEAKTDRETRKDYLDRFYGKPAQSIDVNATLNDRRVEDLSDDELVAIVIASRDGTADEAPGAADATDLH